MASDTITIIKQDEEIKFDESGRLVEQIRIAFKVGDDGPFLKRFPKEGFSSVTARAALEDFGRELARMRA